MIQAVIIQKVVKLIAKQFKLDKILDYVEKPNELDEDMEHLKARIESLEMIDELNKVVNIPIIGEEMERKIISNLFECMETILKKLMVKEG